MVTSDKENLLLIGISYKTAHVNYREKFSFSKETVSKALKDIKRINGVNECVILSTCNRTEIYILADGYPDKVRERISEYITNASGMGQDFLRFFYCRKGVHVIKHLFHVTSSLDSMIIGETQILGQVKNAYSYACDNLCTGPILNRLFHTAFQVGKLIRSSTSISEGYVSVSSAAVLLAKKILGSFQNRNALLVGVGKMGTLCAKQLIDLGIKNLYITNRTNDRAVDVAKEFSGKNIPFEKMTEIFDKVDVIITSASLSKPLITKNNLLECSNKRNGNPLVLVDLGVPRNIDPDAVGIKNVFLYTIDDLEALTLKNHGTRKSEISKAERIIEEKVDDYCSWLIEREVVPVITNLREKCESIRQNELKKINNQISSETFELIDLVTRRIVRKILHNPTITMRRSESGKDRERLIESIKELFINETETSEKEGKLIEGYFI